MSNSILFACQEPISSAFGTWRVLILDLIDSAVRVRLSTCQEHTLIHILIKYIVRL